MRALALFTILVGVVGYLTATAQAPAGSETDLSGVYAAVYVGSPETVIPPEEYPFTAEGARVFNSYDPAVDDPRVGRDCAPERMPALLWSANPMEIVQEDERIVIRFEAGDTIRSIPLNGPPAPADQPHTDLGYSVAYWVGGALTIETTHMMGGVIVNDMGQPISPDARITERYWREPGENDLQLELLVDDPANYTEPARLGRVWVWSPGEQVRPWSCFSLGPRESGAADVDDLARMLEEL